MTWTKLGDEYLNQRAIRRGGPDAAYLDVVGRLWCNTHLTDGEIAQEPAELKDFAAFAMLSVAQVKKRASILCSERVQIWRDTGDFWQIVDFLDTQLPAAEVEKQRRQARERQRAKRQRDSENKSTTASLSQRDGTCDNERDDTGTHIASHATPSRPVPTRPDLTSSSSSDNGFSTPAPRSDEDDRFHPTIEALVECKRNARNLALPNDDPVSATNEKWRTATRANTLTEHAATVRQMLASNPTATPDAIAAAVHSGTDRVREPAPRSTRRDCGECQGHAWIFDDAGSARPCPSCRAQGPAA